MEYQIKGIPTTSRSKLEGGREEWMIELPEVKKVTDLGLGARTFRTSEGPDFSDRTSWTDTPNTEKKAAVAQTEDIQGRLASIQERERDKAMEKMKRKHEKKHKRDKSILELHEKKLKKKKVRIAPFQMILLPTFLSLYLQKKHKDDKPVRRPFSRDMDLGVNTVDEAKRKAAIKSSKLLDNRFAGGSNRFL